MLLRESLSNAIAKLDPEGKDPALHKMVLVGHSQGGLLVKMQVVDSGDRLWRAASKVPVEDLHLSDTTRVLIERGMFVKPSPYVSRVVFLCTPHRGSYVAGRNFIANNVRRLLALPFTLAGGGKGKATADAAGPSLSINVSGLHGPAYRTDGPGYYASAVTLGTVRISGKPIATVDL